MKAAALALAAAACAPILGIDDVGLEGPASLPVEAGQFTMGCGDGPGCDGDEQTHFVTLAAFEIDETEVTRGQYRRCVEAGVCQEPACDYDPMQATTHPVVCVRWVDASAYCERLGKRLPTEAEWEKAARWVDGRPYPWGTMDPTCAQANFFGCSGGAERVGSHPEGESVYGALDMAGNVWEWVADWYDANYYLTSPADNPPGPSVPTSGRVIRGGSWQSSPFEVRTANRDSRPESDVDATRGFRCAR